jgi:hypothetical protein
VKKSREGRTKYGIRVGCAREEEDDDDDQF